MIRPPRLTVRRLMVAVAIAGVLVWSTMIGLRALEYRRLAVHHEGNSSVLSGEYASLGEQAEEARRKGAFALMADLERDREERRKALSEQERIALAYRRAMWRPWRKVGYR
jgi:hypothetical protein